MIRYDWLVWVYLVVLYFAVVYPGIRPQISRIILGALLFVMLLVLLGVLRLSL